jgi:hypothetical protein
MRSLKRVELMLNRANQILWSVQFEEHFGRVALKAIYTECDVSVGFSHEETGSYLVTQKFHGTLKIIEALASHDDGGNGNHVQDDCVDQQQKAKHDYEQRGGFLKEALRSLAGHRPENKSRTEQHGEIKATHLALPCTSSRIPPSEPPASSDPMLYMRFLWARRFHDLITNFQDVSKRLRCASVTKQHPPTIKVNKAKTGINVKTQDSNVLDAADNNNSTSFCTDRISTTAFDAATPYSFSWLTKEPNKSHRAFSYWPDSK